MTNEDFDRIQYVLNEYADWMKVGGSITNWYPRKSMGAADSRIHSIEDMEEQVDSYKMQCIDACVNDLFKISPPKYFALMQGMGLQASVWRNENFSDLYDQALEFMFKSLGKRIVL